MKFQGSLLHFVLLAGASFFILAVMAWASSARTHQGHGLIKNERAYQAMLKTDRANYVVDKSAAYQDSPQLIGWGATISAPHMHAMCIDLLADHLKPGGKALDIGSGNGYLTAAFAHMVYNKDATDAKEQGGSFGVEHIKGLVEFSRRAILNEPKEIQEIIDFSDHDGRLGWEEKGPFDAIHVGAAAPETPKALKQQLKIGGRLVIPVGTLSGWVGSQELMQIDRVSETEWQEKSITAVAYVPLTDRHYYEKD